jgi:predicted RNA-binding Zn-ribbon protein involved in translation (DUF1610 family)
MPDTITCSDQACGATIETIGKEVGAIVKCPKCGKSNTVLASFGDEFNIDSLMPSDDEAAHPARIKCTNCGELLGVRDAVCKKCGADVRSGVSQIRITREEREKRGLFSRKPKPAPAPQPITPTTPLAQAQARRPVGPKARGVVQTARRPVKKKGMSPAMLALIVVAGLVVVAAIVVGVLIALKS